MNDTVKPESAAMVHVREIAAEANGKPLANVTGVAYDAEGLLYAACGLEDPILVFDPDGAEAGRWGRGIIANKHGLRIIGDSLWVTDIGDHIVVEFDLEGRVRRVLGQRGSPGEDESHFNQPTDVARGVDGDLYISDGYVNSRVVRLDRAGRFKSAWGRAGSGKGEFDMPHNIVCGPDGRVYVADRGNRRLQAFSGEGEWLSTADLPGNAFSLAWNGDGRLLASCVQEEIWHGVIVYDAELREQGRFGGFGRGPGQFVLPHGLARDPVTRLLAIGDAGDQRIQFFNEAF